MKKLLCCLIIISTMLSGIFAQTGGIRGRVLDVKAQVTLPGVTVWVEIGKATIAVNTDEYGYFHIKGLLPGLYNVNMSFFGYNTRIINSVSVNSNQTTPLTDSYLTPNHLLPEIEIGEYKDKLIDTRTIDVIRAKDIKNIPNGRNLGTLLNAVIPAVYIVEETKEVYFRGARNGSVIYYVDGVKQRDSEYKIPGSAVSCVMVYMGDVPAKYGDFDGGVVVVETKSYFDYEAEMLAASKR
jgi:hypothetical protein